ncbi:MAG: methyl coenzyme M reductase beta subunit [Patiriisocius sp.]|jgi:methyl coenzyme M reductase beta subunit
MKRVYSHPNSMIVGSMSSALNEEGIETETRNELLGGATGEIAPGETWVELWIVNEAQAEAATKRIKEILEQPERDDWLCNHCQESNPATFDVCWQCGELG